MLVLKYLPDGNILCVPDSPVDFDKVFQLRWQILRKPWNQAPGSEQDLQEFSATHRAVIDSETGSIIACGRLQVLDNETGQIRYMAVHENFQGKGYGRVVLKSLEDAAMEKGLQRIILNAREPAVAFYTRNGYGLETETAPFLGIRHFRMSKLLFEKTFQHFNG